MRLYMSTKAEWRGKSAFRRNKEARKEAFHALNDGRPFLSVLLGMLKNYGNGDGNGSRGVALLAALFVLMVMSILSIGLLSNVDEDLKISKNEEFSERALKIAETGIQVARSTFFDPSNITELNSGTLPVTSVNGFSQGGYFMAYLTSGFAGREKWTQWRYDLGISGNNAESEITAPLMRVWATGQTGTNGSWRSGNQYYVTNLFGVAATGVYFPIENGASGTTVVRSHQEHTGELLADRPMATAAYYVRQSPMTSYSRYDLDSKGDPILREQSLYFTYNGCSSSCPSSRTTADTVSTVRLRGVDLDVSDMKKSTFGTRWEFDTGIHGVATAPTLFDPTPPIVNGDARRGDEVLYFVVIAMGPSANALSVPGQNRPKDLNEDTLSTAASQRSFAGYPSDAVDAPEQLYLFAVIDQGVNSYALKWTTPFPDPDVAEWTDYPMEHATGTQGQRPPFVARPSDMTPFMPEDDLLSDYRDGPGIKANKYGSDFQWNMTRGNVFGADPQAVSPPVVSVLYKDKDGKLTSKYDEATDASKLAPTVDVYLSYSFVSRAAYARNTGSYTDVTHNFSSYVLQFPDTFNGTDVQGFDSDIGYGKANSWQTRVVAIRDRFVNAGGVTSWNWNHARSRFPEFKWTYRAPGWDPNFTDAIPPTGYGQYSWDTWFDQQVAPMIALQDATSEPASGASRRNGAKKIWLGSGGVYATGSGYADKYTVLYPYYKTTGFPAGMGAGNSTTNGERGPTVAQGSPADFSAQSWSVSKVMLMAIRDTWEDYIAGRRTNIAGVSNANLALSNPVEPYWYFSSDDNASGPNVVDYKYQNGDAMVTYIAAPATAPAQPAPYPPGVQVGFPRPYMWSELTWNANVKGASSVNAKEYSLYRQGWSNYVASGGNSLTNLRSYDVDIEGETAAMCKECLSNDGLIALAFNHDLTFGGDNNTATNLMADEDLRLHGINARTGLHVWDYHTPASLDGDNANCTPAIANNRVFMAYMMYNAENNTNNRRALITVLDVADGTEQYTGTVDADADAVLLPPTIANGMAYVATYDFRNPYGSTAAANMGNDVIRLFALSPILRLVSTGVYPMTYKGHENFKDTNATKRFGNYSTMLKDTESEYRQGHIGTSRRTLQVWITGETSRWSEVKENAQ